jgi:hypothetical protein
LKMKFNAAGWNCRRGQKPHEINYRVWFAKYKVLSN